MQVHPMTQPEQVLEDQLVAQLIGQGYTRAAVTDEESMLANLKAQLEAFNGLPLTAGEFTKVLNHLTKSSGVFEKAKILRDRMKLTKEDGTTVYLEFFDSVDPLRNRYQVTQQVAMDGGTYKNRYDVTILVNGLPLVQIELKRRGLEMKEAFNQIQRYQKHSYWSAQGLFHFVQLFVISNGVNTKYYANARKQSFKQTFYWASEDNKTIRELPAFTTAFLNREHLGGMIGKYTVLNETDKILIRKLILDSVAGDIELRSKRELIQKFIESNLPKLDSSAEIPDSFEDFWEKERVAAFDKLVKEEQLDADKLKQVIDRYIYTGQEPLPDPDIVNLIQKPLGILERGPTRKRVLEKVVDFVATFVRGVAA